MTSVLIIDRFFFGFLLLFLFFFGLVVTWTLLVVLVAVVTLMVMIDRLRVHESIVQNVSELVEDVILTGLAVLLARGTRGLVEAQHGERVETEKHRYCRNLSLDDFGFVYKLRLSI